MLIFIKIGNSKEIVSSLLFEKKSSFDKIDVLQEKLDLTQKELEKIKEECSFFKPAYLSLKQDYQIIDIKYKKTSEELEFKINENIELRQELNNSGNKRSSDSEKIVNLESKNQELLSEIERLNKKFEGLSEEMEEKFKKELNGYTQNFMKFNQVLISTKNVIIALKEEKDKFQLNFKFLNENHQTLNCKYIHIANVQKELIHKLEIMNVIKL